MKTNYPILEDETQRLANQITDEDLTHYALKHEILGYGIRGVVHVHLMRMAKDISKGKISLNDFRRKYDLRFDTKLEFYGVPLEKIESDGVFIPRQDLLFPVVQIFDRDNLNRVYTDDWDDKKYAIEFLNKADWKESDLEDPEIVETGIRFGKDLWKSAVWGFNYYKNGDKIRDRYRVHGILGILKSDVPKMPKNLKDLGVKLISYYDQIVNLEDKK